MTVQISCEVVWSGREREGGLGSDRGGVEQLKRKANLPFNNLSINRLASSLESNSTGKNESYKAPVKLRKIPHQSYQLKEKPYSLTSI